MQPHYILIGICEISMHVVCYYHIAFYIATLFIVLNAFFKINILFKHIIFYDIIKVEKFTKKHYTGKQSLYGETVAY